MVDENKDYIEIVWKIVEEKEIEAPQNKGEIKKKLWFNSMAFMAHTYDKPESYTIL